MSLHAEPRPVWGSRLLRPTRSWRVVVIAAVVAVVVVTAGGFAVRAGGSWEMPASIALNRLHVGALAAIGDLLYHVVSPVPAIAITAVLTVVLLIVSRDLRIAATFAVTIAVSWLPLAVVKLLVHRPRPEASMLPHPYHPIQVDASYPSGHEAFVTALVATLVLAVGGLTARRIATVVGAIVVVVAALLLAIDAVHYPTDVIASVVWVLGVLPLVRAAWVQLAIIRGEPLWRRLRREPPGVRRTPGP